MGNRKPEHESIDTVNEMREFAYRAPSPDSEPPEKPESGASESLETEGVAIPAEPGLDDLDEEQSRRHSA